MTTSEMTVSGIHNKVGSLVGCKTCRHYIQPAAKFCGNCGASQDMGSTATQHKLRAVRQFSQEIQDFAGSKDRAESNRQNKQAAAQKLATPDFARKKKRGLSPAAREEMVVLETMLVRERFFLLMHCSIFLVVNLIGLFIALKCYFEFNGDEMAKIMMATTPLMFINLVALTSLVPIKSTKREIARLIERKTYLKLQSEYENLF